MSIALSVEQKDMASAKLDARRRGDWPRNWSLVKTFPVTYRNKKRGTVEQRVGVKFRVTGSEERREAVRRGTPTVLVVILQH